MVARGKYWGFHLDGLHKGKVRESQHRYFAEVISLDTYSLLATGTSILVPALDIEHIRYQWQQFALGARTYGVWIREGWEQSADYMTDVVLVLIDMHPEQARLCETRTRRI